MRRLLLDLNIVLDVLLDRRPHVEAAALLWSEIERGKAEGLLPAHAFTTIFYLAKKERDGGFAQQVLADLLNVFRVVPVDEGIIRRALALSWPDFEDAVCAACAAAASADVLVTRDPGGFARSPVTLLNPAAAVAWLQAQPTT